MNYPIPEMVDRFSILRLKKERIGDKDSSKEYHFLKNELRGRFDSFVYRLYSVNKKIWDLESDIRKGKEGKLGLKEVGFRAIRIRNLNEIRVRIKNELAIRLKLPKDIKKNHASEAL